MARARPLRIDRDDVEIFQSWAGLSFFCVYTASFSQGKLSECKPMLERSQAILEKLLGPEHPMMANILDKRANLLREQVRAARMF